MFLGLSVCHVCLFIHSFVGPCYYDILSTAQAISMKLVGNIR